MVVSAISRHEAPARTTSWPCQVSVNPQQWLRSIPQTTTAISCPLIKRQPCWWVNSTELYKTGDLFFNCSRSKQKKGSPHLHVCIISTPRCLWMKAQMFSTCRFLRVGWDVELGDWWGEIDGNTPGAVLLKMANYASAAGTREVLQQGWPYKTIQPFSGVTFGFCDSNTVAGRKRACLKKLKTAAVLHLD